MQFACPNCKAEALVRAGEGVAKAAFSCSTCKATFPVVDDIPRFLNNYETNYADSFGFQWNLHSGTQLDSVSGVRVSEDRVDTVTGWPQDLRGQTILEAGSGSGRFTEILAKRGATLYTFDYSNAVDANRRNNSKYGNVTFFQGDILNPPFKPKQFDKVFCLGVLQHTENPDAAFKSLASLVKPGGELVVDIYSGSLSSRISWRYLLRPLTSKIDSKVLYRAVNSIVPLLLPITMLFSKALGRLGRKLMPIPEYSYLGLPYKTNLSWSILDTFDIYAPKYDQPRTPEQVQRWYDQEGFTTVAVSRGINGVVARGKRPPT